MTLDFADHPSVSTIDVAKAELERCCEEWTRHAFDSAASFVTISESRRLEPSWLGARELERLASLRMPKRRSEWLAGRRAAKLALGKLLGPLDAAVLEVLPRADGMPVVHRDGRSLPEVGVTVAHSGDLAGALAWHANGGALGLDVERVVPLHENLLRFAFDGRERRAVLLAPDGRLRDLAALRMWCAKESVLKARGAGLRWPLRSVHIEVVAGETWSAEACDPETGHSATDVVRTCTVGDYVVAVALSSGYSNTQTQ